jgi:ankyrin repeat protein
MYVIAETTGKDEDWQSAIEHARLAIHDYVRQGGDPADLAERDSKGMTPLIAAAYMGYPEIVGELLADKRVAAGINDTDARGRSAWVYANFALRQSAWLCNPAMAQNIFALVPLMVTLPYYLGSDEPPYRRTRKLLESAGAKANMDAAKQQWLDTCKSADAETRQKVAGSHDLLDTLAEEASENLPLSNGPSPTRN